MKVVRYDYAGETRYGELRDGQVLPMTGEFGLFAETRGPPLALADVRLRAPVMPSKIVAVGPNFHSHARRRNPENPAPPPPRPFLWIKPPTTVVDPEGTVLLPNHPNGPVTVCHEAEVAVVIGRRCSRVSPAEALDYVFGYTCIIDVTSSIDQPNFRELQDFIDGKVFDTFGPLGPHIETDLDATKVRVQCRVNGETRQDERMTGQIWPIPELISIVSHSLTLLPGDVVATGTPPGMSALRDGDVVEADVEGIGVLRVSVAARDDRRTKT